MQSLATICSQKSRWLLVLVLAGTLISGGLVSADQRVSTRGAAPVLTVQVDFSAFVKSQFGSMLIQAGSMLAAEEMEKDPQEAIKALIKSIGFDPLEQDIKLTAVIADLEEPLDGLQLDIQFKNSTGNLEGLLLAVPGYRSSRHDDHTVHTVTIDNQDIFIAFHTDPSGKKQVFVSGSQSDVTRRLDALGDESASDAAAWKMPEGQFVNVQLTSLPADLIEDTPLTNIAQLINESSLSLGEADNDLVAQVTLTATEEERAIQLQQLAQGAVAMVGLFREEIRQELADEASADTVLPVLDQISVQRVGKTVTIQTKVSKTAVVLFLREEADLPL
ncbi:MAG: hypothetical protein MI861_02085 [Pirellulales bacterium]|nr:hypothetical protein [Pirellulales bacterium]